MLFHASCTSLCIVPMSSGPKVSSNSPHQVVPLRSTMRMALLRIGLERGCLDEW